MQEFGDGTLAGGFTMFYTFFPSVIEWLVGWLTSTFSVIGVFQPPTSTMLKRNTWWSREVDGLEKPGITHLLDRY